MLWRASIRASPFLLFFRFPVTSEQDVSQVFDALRDVLTQAILCGRVETRYLFCQQHVVHANVSKKKLGSSCNAFTGSGKKTPSQDRYVCEYCSAAWFLGSTYGFRRNGKFGRSFGLPPPDYVTSVSCSHDRCLCHKVVLTSLTQNNLCYTGDFNVRGTESVSPPQQMTGVDKTLNENASLSSQPHVQKCSANVHLPSKCREG